MDRWEKHVKIRRIVNAEKNEGQKKQENQERAIAYSNFMGAITRFCICCTCLSNKNVRTQEEYDSLVRDFNSIKEEVKQSIMRLEEKEQVIPDKLRCMIENCENDSFNSLEEV